MGNRKTTGTVAEWLIEEELADYRAAKFFLEDTVKEFVQDMEKFQYSLRLLYEAQKDNQSDLLGAIQSLRSCIPAIQNIQYNCSHAIPAYYPYPYPARTAHSFHGCSNTFSTPTSVARAKIQKTGFYFIP